MLLLGLTSAALAWGLHEETWTTSSAPESAVVASRPSGPRLVVGEVGRVVVLGASGEEVASADVDGAAVAAADVDGDGLEDVLACGSDGFAWVPWAADGSLAAPVIVDPRSCDAVAVGVLDGVRTVVTSNGTSVSLWTVAGGALDGPTDAGVTLAGPPLLAGSDLGFVAGSAGDRAVYVTPGWTRDDLDHGADALGWWGTYPAAATDGSVVTIGAADDWSVAGDAGPFAFTDVDADGHGDDLVLLRDGDSIVVDPNLWTRTDTGWDTAGDPPSQVLVEVSRSVGGADALAVGEIDGDACPELVVVDTAGHAVDVFSASPCVDDRDADGDGYAVADGDCDDADPARNPGEAELCDGVDQDCDGAVDEAGLHVSGPTSASEGDVGVYVAAAEGCSPPAYAGLGWSADGPANCQPTESGAARCGFLDDGAVVLTASAVDGGGAVVLTGQTAVSVRNVAPVLHPVDEIDLPWCRSVFVPLETVDVPDDPIQLQVRGGPPWVRVTGGGSLSVDPSEDTEDPEGRYDVEIVANDGDGGRASTTMTIEVGMGLGCLVDDCPPEPDTGDEGYGWGLGFGCDDSDSGGCCCGGGGLGFLLPTLLWGMARRR